MVKKIKKLKSGMVSIVGRPNVGKSTLLNTLVGEKITIVSKVPQTTRNNVRGIYNDERGQIVFIDTPGLMLGKDKLDRLLKKSSLGTIHDVDCVIHLVDTSEPVGRGEQEIVGRLSELKVPVVLGLNKVDLKGPFIPQYIELWEKAKGKPANEIKKFAMVAVSGQRDINRDVLLDVVFGFLPKGEALYPPDWLVDVPQKMAMADIIREKFLNLLRDELPHSLAVFIEEIQPRSKKITSIKAAILVERDTQKMIAIGKNGHVLKQVGILARKELEELLETQVYLELFVKVQKNWRDNESTLIDLGYESQL